ncbi:MAG: adenylate/guanylate cyclase domain-containing protein [Elusimicrobia bacterium]|nr:adenylate/guanylate cyclase domain-containing protein [Elusimicrobiota bacterium]
MALFRRESPAISKPAPSSVGKSEGTGPERAPWLIALAIAFSVSVLTFGGAFDSLNLRWNDQLFRWRGFEEADERVVVVTIDDESIKKVGQFPWPRSVYAKLIRKLFARGVKVVALDVMFYEPSRPEEDAELIKVTKEFGARVVHAGNMDPEAKQEHVFRSPFPALHKAAKSIGAVDQLLIDKDGAVRVSYLIYGRKLWDYIGWLTDPSRIPALGLKALAVYEGKSPDEYLKKFPNRIYLNTRGQGFYELKDPQTGAPLHLAKYGIPRIQTWRVLRDELLDDHKERLDGGIVLLGYTAAGTFDHYPSPFSESQPGVEVHANVIDNLLNDRLMKEAAEPITFLLCFAFALVAAWFVGLHPLMGALAAAGVFLGWTWTSYFLFKRLQLVQFVPPSLSIIGTYALLLIRKILSEQAEKRFIKQTFGQFVAPEVVDKLVKDPSLLRLGGEKREMTVFFLDIAHFTTISEKMDPESLILFLNKYLSALSKVVQDNKGVVDKYIGDCIMAFWNAPLDDPQHRVNACLTAVECQKVVEELNKDLDPKLPERPAIRIGVNSGDMTVGLTGSEKKLAYTVIGDEVNLASRLEGANKFFGSKIMISEECLKGAEHAVEFRILGQVRVVGKSIPIKVYELLAAKGKLSPEWQKALPLYEKGMELYLAEKWTEAKDVFAEVLKIIPNDDPTKFYQRRCEDFSVIPPMDDWRVIALTAK